VEKVIEEVSIVFGQDRPVSCIVSVGAGQAGITCYDQPDPFERVLPRELIKVLKAIATDTDKVAHEMSKRHRTTGIYYRFNVDQGLDSVSLDEWKHLDAVRHHTKNYLKKTDVGGAIDKLVSVLVDGPSASHVLEHTGTTIL
jgi:hypothetical protein